MSEEHEESELFIENLLVRVHFIIVIIGCTALVPYEFELCVPGSLASTFNAQGLARD